jgi:hypothetical protein
MISPLVEEVDWVASSAAWEESLRIWPAGEMGERAPPEWE